MYPLPIRKVVMANRVFKQWQTLTPELVMMSIRWYANGAGTDASYENGHGLTVKEIDGSGLVTLALTNPAVALVAADLNVRLNEAFSGSDSITPQAFYIADDRSSDASDPEIDIQVIDIMTGDAYDVGATGCQYHFQFYFRQTTKVNG